MATATATALAVAVAVALALTVFGGAKHRSVNQLWAFTERSYKEVYMHSVKGLLVRAFGESPY